MSPTPHAPLGRETAAFITALAHRHQDKAWELGTRLTWAGLISNGGAIVACASMVGNVDHPDAALSALTPALGLFTVGLLAGGIANFIYQTAFCLSAQALAVTATGFLVDKTYEARNASPEEAFALHKAALRRRDLSRRLHFASLAMCFLGLVLVLASHATGRMHLEPPHATTPAR